MDTTIINEVWRPLYGDLQQGFSLLTPEWSMLKRLEGWKELSEREVIWPTNLRFGGGVAATVDGGTPARAMSNAPVEATETWAWFARRFQVSMAIMKAKGDATFKKSKIREQLTYQTLDAMESFRKRIAIAFWGFDDNVLAEIKAVGGAPVYTLKDRYGRTGLAVDVDVFSPNNDYVAIVDPAATTSERGRDLVVDVTDDPVDPSIELAGAVAGAAASDLVVFANQLDQTAGVHDYGLGFPGLLQHIHGATLHGIATADEPEWAPGLVVDKAGGALDESELFVAFATSNRRSPHKVDYALSTIGVIAAAGGAQLDKVRYTPQPGDVYLGFDSLTAMGVKVQIAEFAPSGYFVADSRASLRKFSPDDEPFKVMEGGEEFHYYGTVLGYFCDILYRVGLTRFSRRSLIAYYNVLESTGG